MVRDRRNEGANPFIKYLADALGITAIVTTGMEAAVKAMQQPVLDEGNTTPPNSPYKEETFVKFISDAALPRKAEFYTSPSYPRDPSDLVRSREEPILFNTQIEEIVDNSLRSRTNKEGIPDYVDNLDRFWAGQHAATLLAFAFLEQYHHQRGRKYYTARYQDFLAGRFLMYRRLVDSIKLVMPDLKGRRVSEVGGGSGLSLTMLAREGAEAHNLDISEVALRYFEYLAKHYKVKERTHTMRADFFNIEQPENTFDLTYNVGVFEHFKKDEQTRLLEEMVRITASGGLVMVSVPNENSPYYKLMHDKETKVPENKRLPMPFRGYVDPVELLKSAGLEPVNKDGYARGYTQIAPPTRISPGMIKPKDFPFFRQLPFESGTTMETLLRAWYLLESNAQQTAPHILENYAMFTHAFGRKPG